MSSVERQLAHILHDSRGMSALITESAGYLEKLTCGSMTSARTLAIKSAGETCEPPVTVSPGTSDEPKKMWNNYLHVASMLCL